MSDLTGKTIGEYQILQVTAEYGDRWLYRAYQPGQDRYVTVTVMKPQAAQDAPYAARFLQQASLAAELSHPNLLPVYASGQTDEIVYRVSAQVENGTVRENLSQLHSLLDVVGLLSQAAAGLEYLHGQGFIHGNLKATNTYLDAQPRLLLSEFGLSQPAGETADPYRSPEQVQGGLVDKRTDVYALGVLLYELLTGGPPPAGVVVSPSARRPDLPQAVERVVLKAMAQNPDQRFQSAAAFREVLEQAVQVPGAQPQAPAAGVPAPTPTAAPTVSQSVQVQQPKGTNWAAILLGLVLVAICLGGLFLIVPNLLDGEEAAPPPEATLEQPTPEPLPTDPPQPTEPPDEPAEPPPSEQLPENPEQLPADPGGQLPDICGSLGGAGLLALFGMVASLKRRKARRQ